MIGAAKNTNRRRVSGFSLVEILLVVFIIGVLVLITIPIVQGIEKVSVRKTKRNAQQIAEISNNMSAIGVAHVLPESLGGAEATARLIRLGLEVKEEGSIEGLYMGLPSLGESEIGETSEYLKLAFDGKDLRLDYNESGRQK